MMITTLLIRIYLHVKGPYKTKYQYFIKTSEEYGVKNLKGPTAFVEFSNNTQDVYKNIEEYNPIR